MCNIPGDVIQLIIDESVPPASFDTWSVRAETLLSLCRVNRAWVQVARRELYRCPLISGKGVQFLSAASKTGRWAQTREIRFLDVDFGKRAVNNVLSRSSGTLNHIWIANCEKVDLSRIAKARNLISLHLYDSSFKGATFEAPRRTRSSSNMVQSHTVKKFGELRFPFLQSLSLLGSLHLDETHFGQLMSLSPENSPRLDTICAVKKPYVLSSPASWNVEVQQIMVMNQAIEAFKHQLCALSEDGTLFLGKPTNDHLSSNLHLLSVRGQLDPGFYTPEMGSLITDFCASRRYLLRPTPLTPSPHPLYGSVFPRVEDIETLYIGKLPFPDLGNGRGATKLFDCRLAGKWLDHDGEPTVVLWREDLVEITEWDKAWNSGFWKVVAELRKSLEWNT